MSMLYVYLVIQFRGKVSLFVEEAYLLRENAEAAVEQYERSYLGEGEEIEINFQIQEIKLQDASGKMICDTEGGHPQAEGLSRAEVASAPQSDS